MCSRQIAVRALLAGLLAVHGVDMNAQSVKQDSPALALFRNLFPSFPEKGRSR